MDGRPRSLAPALLVALLGIAIASCSPDAASKKNKKPSGSDAPSACADADGDGISDEDEGRAERIDTDGDGIPDYLDEDSDGDGIPDSLERGGEPCAPPVDSDGDGTPDFRDLDSDDNGRPDWLDGTDDLDGDGIPDFQDPDDDGDEIPDSLEIGDDPFEPVDTDGDGIPDFQDIDSDDDTILDAEEGFWDTDGDGIPDFRDLDSDGDCIPDSIEAGDDDLYTPPVDTDGDGIPDYLDIDSDNDGLPDGEEDKNCNGVLDPGESSPHDTDTDGDGVSDMVESAAGTDPNDPNDSPTANGDFYFLMPYQKPPTPKEDTLDFATKIVNADIAFSMDTTASMSGAIGNLKSSLKTIATQLRTDIPNVAFGVVDYRDFPTGGFGAGSDWPFKLRHRVMTVNTDPGMASVQNAVNQLVHGGGADVPESGWEALYQIATGAGVHVGNANVPAFNPITALPMPPPAGEKIGDIGGVGFRPGALPIVVQITDAESHNSDGQWNYNFAGAATRSMAIGSLNAIGAKVIGVVNSTGTPRTDITHAVRGTGALVPPDAWGAPGAGRPASCAVGSCCTKTNGAGEPVDPGTGMCPLTFTVSADGSGLGTSAVDAIKALTQHAVLDIGAVASDDPADSVDAVQAFVSRLEANPTAGAPCVAGLTVEDRAGHGVPDTFVKVMPGTQVCFDVIPKSNTTVKPTTKPQLFKVFITVKGDDVTDLDTRTVFFLVPPELPGSVVK